MYISEHTHTVATLPRITIVVSFRERWSWAVATVLAVLRHTPAPFRLWVLDTGMPDVIRTELQGLMAAPFMEIIPAPAPGMWPNQARGAVAARIDTPYAVFIDNDVLVSPGWLEPLLACADETGAGIVGPLYLWGEDEKSDLIHMAGGELQISEDGGKTVMGERHRLINTRLGDVSPAPHRDVCDFAEFHCLLMRREVFQAPGMFDPDIVCVHEHIHASLLARQLGFATWMEPTSQVFYLARRTWLLNELPLLRERWSAAAAEHSLHHFAQRWNVLDDVRSFGGVRNFARDHVGAIDLVRASLQGPHCHAAMERAALQQTPAGLVLLAQQRGYAAQDIHALANALQLAMRLTNGGYRACGRPFINHLVGTASVLVHYGCELRTVLTGLLHAAYTHSIPHDAPDPARVVHQIMAALGGSDTPLQRSVRAYTLRQQRYGAMRQSGSNTASMPLADAELLLLEAANAIDMHLSLETAATGQRDTTDPALLEQTVSVCQTLGIPGMGQSLLNAEAADIQQGAKLHFHPYPGSFRLQAQGTASMANTVHLPALLHA